MKIFSVWRTFNIDFGYPCLYFLLSTIYGTYTQKYLRFYTWIVKSVECLFYDIGFALYASVLCLYIFYISKNCSKHFILFVVCWHRRDAPAVPQFQLSDMFIFNYLPSNIDIDTNNQRRIFLKKKHLSINPYDNRIIIISKTNKRAR